MFAFCKHPTSEVLGKSVFSAPFELSTNKYLWDTYYAYKELGTNQCTKQTGSSACTECVCWRGGRTTDEPCIRMPDGDGWCGDK